LSTINIFYRQGALAAMAIFIKLVEAINFWTQAIILKNCLSNNIELQGEDNLA